VGAPLLLVNCVKWQSIPPSQLSARALPRWIEVTTIDSARYVLEHAQVRGDTIIGRLSAATEAERPMRIPSNRVAHVEARVPSGSGSIGVTALVVGGLTVYLFLLGRAADSGTP